MGTARPALLALVLVLLLFWSVLPPTVGQGSAGHMVISTDYELFGTSDLRGGGHVTWTLTGAKGTDLRLKILHLFDEYSTIPRGFPFATETTNANHDGRLDPLEGVRYTDLLETELEAAGKGTSAQYVQMYPFDLRDKGPDPATSFDRSTVGLAGTTANTTGDAEIRFLFEANISTTEGWATLPTRAFVDPLYNLFSYDVAQSPTLTSSGPYPGSWPFLPENGWHVVNLGGRPAFWAGNDSTGQYDNNVDVSSRTSADPALASADPRYLPFDFRFASRAWATFNYTGLVNGAGDYLRIEYASPPSYTSWTNLSFGGVRDLPSTAPGVWSAQSVDLTSLLGQKARLRLRFHSDGAGTAPGFYIRDFEVHAPATYSGEVLESDTHYLIGLVSFWGPQVSQGGIQMVRTPGGELLTYGASWDTSALPSDRIYFRTFDPLENPQILFAIMLIACYAISRLQESSYATFRNSHPAGDRPPVSRAWWLHRAGKIAIAALILFYFVPTATWVIGIRATVSGLIYWILAFALVLVFGFVTPSYYKRHLEGAPPAVLEEEAPAALEEGVTVVRKIILPAPSTEDSPVVGRCMHCQKEIRESDRTYRCTCGALFHFSCASGLVRCTSCQKPIAAGVLSERKPMSLRCESCGELQTVLEGTDPRVLTCGNCGGRLRHLDVGKRYLMVANNPAVAITWMRDLIKGGKPALIITHASPDRIRLEFGVKKAPIIQVSERASGAIPPQDLDPVGLRSILPLAREGKGGVILYDGLDEMIAESSLAGVIRFLRKANDMAFVHGVTVIGRVAPGRLSESDLKRLNGEFDEFLALSAQP
jgi:hypothetical protein